MLPEAAYPHPLPLSRAHALDLVARAAELELRSTFACFVMIAIEERIGEWRYAGHADSFAGVVACIDAFADALGFPASEQSGPRLAEWLEIDALQIGDETTEWWSLDDLELEELGEHRLVLFGEGGAPYDDFGVCVIELGSVEGTRLAGLAPQTERPDTWPDPNDDEDQ